MASSPCIFGKTRAPDRSGSNAPILLQCELGRGRLGPSQRFIFSSYRTFSGSVVSCQLLWNEFHSQSRYDFYTEVVGPYKGKYFPRMVQYNIDNISTNLYNNLSIWCDVRRRKFDVANQRFNWKITRGNAHI